MSADIPKKSQRDWYNYYKENPEGKLLESLTAEIEDNYEMSEITKQLTLHTLYWLHRLPASSVDDYITRQQDIVMNHYLLYYNMTNPKMEVSVLQARLYSLQHFLAESDENNMMDSLAEIVECCYRIAEMFDRDLDVAIFKKIEEESSRSPFAPSAFESEAKQE